MPKSEFKIGKLEVKDLPAVLAIEKVSFKDPWSYEAFLWEITNPNAHTFRVKREEDLLGYMILWQYEASIHIGNLTIAPKWRRQGIGTLLVEEAFKVAKKTNASWITLEVRVTNKVGQKFYEKLGFKLKRIIKGYYRPNFEDALLYEWENKSSK